MYVILKAVAILAMLFCSLELQGYVREKEAELRGGIAEED